MNLNAVGNNAARMHGTARVKVKKKTIGGLMYYIGGRCRLEFLPA